jgi:hypothetical protein
MEKDRIVFGRRCESLVEWDIRNCFLSMEKLAADFIASAWTESLFLSA